MSRNPSQQMGQLQTLRQRNSRATLTGKGADAVPQRMVGMTNSAPSLVPDGQRAVTVLVLV